MKQNRRGIFITFEGSEGSGKSTQSAMLYNYLKRKRLPIVHIREPGGTVIGEQIRKILLNPGNKAMGPICETLLYMAARVELARGVIKPALKQNRIVICDRFLDSTRAYQGYGLGVDMKMIEYIGNLATDKLVPDLTIFLDIPTKIGLRRAGAVKDRIERRSILYHQRVRRGYLNLAKRFSWRIKIIKVDKDKNKTQAKIRELVVNCLKNKKIQ
jgi:dTMP kinase